MGVTGMRRSGGMGVEMGIEPDQAGRLTQAPTNATPSPGGNRMVATDDQWALAGNQRVVGHIRHLA